MILGILLALGLALVAAVLVVGSVLVTILLADIGAAGVRVLDERRNVANGGRRTNA